MKKALLFLVFSLPLLFYANGQYVTNGHAISTGGDCFRLTPDLFTQGGSVWFQNKISLASDFTVEASVNLGSRDIDGADGLAFVLQPVCSGLGGIGGGLGYLGITPSLAVELDTWLNPTDPVEDHIGLMKNGDVTHGPGGASVLQGYNIFNYNIEDGLYRTLKVEWTASTQNLKVYYNGNLEIDYTDDIVANIFGGNSNVFWGFTAATGSARNEHNVCIVDASFTEEGSFTVTKPSCPNFDNGAIDLNPAGGIGPFSYLWSNGAITEDITGLSAGTYEVTVTDGNGCETKYSIDVTNEIVEIPTCSIASIPSNNIYTGGVPTNLYIGYGPQSTTLQVSAPASGAPYTYSWSGGTLSNYNTANPVFTATAEGTFTFTVEVTNKYGCKATCTITICVMDITVPGSKGKKVYVCHVPPGNPANAHTISISVNAVPAHVGLHGGDRLGDCDMVICTPEEETENLVSQKVIVGFDEPVKELTVTVSPNPTSDRFVFRLQSNEIAPVTIRIVNGLGQAVETANKVNANSTIYMGGSLRGGMYFAEVRQGDQRKIVKLIKQ